MKQEKKEVETLKTGKKSISNDIHKNKNSKKIFIKTLATDLGPIVWPLTIELLSQQIYKMTKYQFSSPMTWKIMIGERNKNKMKKNKYEKKKKVTQTQ